MRTLPNRNQSSSNGPVEFDNFHPEEAVGWNADLSIDRYLQNKNAASKLISLARKKISLDSVIFRYNITWTQVPSMSGWTHNTSCPFPDHNDSTPSFGYNSKDHCFKCFGCGRGGGSVDFISGMTGRSHLEIAKELLEKFGTDIIQEIEDAEINKTDELLINFSKKVHIFYQKYIDNDAAFEMVNKLVHIIDLYLEKNAMNGEINFDTLNEYILRFSEDLDKFEA